MSTRNSQSRKGSFNEEERKKSKWDGFSNLDMSSSSSSVKGSTPGGSLIPPEVKPQSSSNASTIAVTVASGGGGGGGGASGKSASTKDTDDEDSKPSFFTPKNIVIPDTSIQFDRSDSRSNTLSPSYVNSPLSPPGAESSEQVTGMDYLFIQSYYSINPSVDPTTHIPYLFISILLLFITLPCKQRYKMSSLGCKDYWRSGSRPQRMSPLPRRGCSSTAAVSAWLD